MSGLMVWFLVALALAGTVLNIRKDPRGFLFWIVSNWGLALVHAQAGQWAQASLFAVYLTLAIMGWISWRLEVRSNA